MRRAPLRLAMIALLAAPALAPGTSRAQERIRLRWSAPEGCPGGDAVKAEVDRLLGGSKVRPAKAIDVSAAVSRDERGGWRVRLETPGDGAPRVRELQGASCRAISDATALILALMIDPDAVAAAPPASATPSATTTSGPAAPARSASPGASPSGTPATPPSPATASTTASTNVPPTASASPALAASASAAAASTASAAPGAPAAGAPAASAPTAPGASTGPAAPVAPFPSPLAPGDARAVPPGTAPPSGASSPISFHLGAWAGADAGTLPGVSAALGVTAALMVGAQRIEVGFAARPGTRASLAQQPTAGGKVDLIAGWAGTCRYLLRGPVALGPCVALEVGRMHAAGFGVTDPTQASEPWVAASAGGILVWSPWWRIGLVLRVDAAVPLARHTFVLEGLGPVHEPAAIAGRAAAGLELAF